MNVAHSNNHSRNYHRRSCPLFVRQNQPGCLRFPSMGVVVLLAGLPILLPAEPPVSSPDFFRIVMTSWAQMKHVSDTWTKILVASG